MHHSTTPPPPNTETADTPADLTACEREPIHIPGSIQPHGVLFALSADDCTIRQWSENAGRFTRQDLSAIGGQGVEVLFEPPYATQLRQMASLAGIENNPTYLFQARLRGAESAPLEWALHRANGVLILEGEPTVPESDREQVAWAGLVRSTIPRLRAAPDLTTLYQAATEEVGRLTGFDRVMVYQFGDEGHGSVVAEVHRTGLEPFLGLHYPASDIPQQARQLYLLNQLRLIADVGYTPAPMLASDAQTTPLDMSYCVLRSVSPVHVEYLKNMGVAASMSISVMKDDALWGLIACHHYTGPRYVPFDVRSACELIGQVVSLQIAAKSDSGDGVYRERIHQVRDQIVENMAATDDSWAGLYAGDVTVRDLIECGGCAVVRENGTHCTRLGTTPSEEQILRIVSLLQRQEHSDAVFATDRLPFLMDGLTDGADEYRSIASGLLSLRIGRGQPTFVLWFRPEFLHSVDWGGNPDKAVTRAEDGTHRLSPRKSFARWRQEVEGRSSPWTDLEQEAVRELSRAILSVVLTKAEEMARLNTDLQRSNTELDAFAYVASHDLKEPLRGIHQYIQFLHEDHADSLPPDATEKLEVLTRLSRRMESLIDSLLHYARVGRLDLSRAAVDMNQITGECQEVLRALLAETGTTVRIPRPLPSGVICDRVQVGEVFSNLVSTAAKYNRRSSGERWVEIGYLTPEEEGYAAVAGEDHGLAGPVIYRVSDNGIGIPARFHETIFGIFRRLHGRDEYGGGTGAGLTITKKIVERHGGRIWLESPPEGGTTFYFTVEGTGV